MRGHGIVDLAEIEMDPPLDVADRIDTDPIR